MKKIRYQLLLLGQNRIKHEEVLIKEIERCFENLGLDFDVHGEVISGSTKTPEWEGFPVAVWFGGPSPEDSGEVNLIKELLDRGFSVFPVVESLNNYNEETPELLHRINGQEFNEKKLAADIMGGFRLTRRLRRAFISYCRNESSGVANQLFHELTEKRYHAFLDTISIETGADFQKSLWSRMADVDLLILLDTPKALASKWVHEELSRAHNLGMGVIQLVWPNHTRTLGTELTTPVVLSQTDFVNQNGNKEDILTDTKLTSVVNIVEGERIRSLNARRTRLVEGLLSCINGKGVTLLVHPARQVDVMKGDDKVAEVLPFVGVPDSMSVHESELAQSHPQTFVVYNGLGVDTQWSEHLNWLNQKAAVEVSQVDDFGKLIEKL